MEEYFVNYNQALALKELGFDEPCFKYIYTGDTGNNVNRYEEVEPSRAKNYSNYNFLCISQPLKSQVFKWFRDEHKTQSLIQEYDINNYMFTIDDGINGDISVVGFKTYEEAESACIDKLIELIKEKKS
jgi:hypothetical protein